MIVIIDGRVYKGITNVEDFKQALAELIDIQWSPLEALKSNMIVLFDLVEEFCKITRETKKGSQRAQLTREINKINNQRKYWDLIQERSIFVKKYYDFILSSEKFDRLRGFGFSNAFGDKIKGNSEIQRISFKHD